MDNIDIPGMKALVEEYQRLKKITDEIGDSLNILSAYKPGFVVSEIQILQNFVDALSSSLGKVSQDWLEEITEQEFFVQLSKKSLVDMERETIPNEVLNVLNLWLSPDEANVELGMTLAKSQFEEDEPEIYQKICRAVKFFAKVRNAIQSHVFNKHDVFVKFFEVDDEGEFIPVFACKGTVRIQANLVENGRLICKFDEVGGSFVVTGLGLKSLRGCPRRVGGDFWCYKNNLTSLEGGPEEVGGDYDAKINYLTTLAGCPKKINGDLHVGHNTRLTSLVGCAEEIGGNFYYTNNPKLPTAKGVAKKIGGICYYGENFNIKDFKSYCDVAGGFVFLL